MESIFFLPVSYFSSLDDRRRPHVCDRCQEIFYHLGHRGHLHHHNQKGLPPAALVLAAEDVFVSVVETPPTLDL